MPSYYFSTVGDSYWSNQARQVRITGISVAYVNDKLTHGELRVYFDTESWNVKEHGLIYTDSGFLRDLQDFLTGLGMAGKDVDYSEQGMQGRDYVSLDVGPEFLQSWLERAMNNPSIIPVS